MQTYLACSLRGCETGETYGPACKDGHTVGLTRRVDISIPDLDGFTVWQCSRCDSSRVRIGGLEALYHFTHVDNIAPISKHGLLSANRAECYHPVDISDSGVQGARRRKRFNDRALHEYVPLFFQPRNATLSRWSYDPLIGQDRLCVIAIDPQIIRNPDVVITDRNAAAANVKSKIGEEGLAMLNPDRLFAESWTQRSDQERRLVRDDTLMHEMQAEVLVPDTVALAHVLFVGVRTEPVARKLRTIADGLGPSIRIAPHLFFP